MIHRYEFTSDEIEEALRNFLNDVKNLAGTDSANFTIEQPDGKGGWVRPQRFRVSWDDHGCGIEREPDFERDGY